MFASTLHSPLKSLLLTGGALSLAACGGSGSYRVASVGSVTADATASDGSGGSGTAGGSGSDGSTGSSGSAGATGPAGTTGSAGTARPAALGRVLVTAGNTVIGASGRHNTLASKINGLAPGTTQITGTVTTVLRKTGQSLVDLGQGQSLILNGAGGKLGEIVKIDLASRTVTGASSGSSLLGVSVLSPTVATGSVAAANVGNTGPLLTVVRGGTSSGVLAPVTGAVTTGAVTTGAVTGTAGGTAAAGTGLSGVTTPVTNVAGGLLGGLKKGPK